MFGAGRLIISSAIAALCSVQLVCCQTVFPPSPALSGVCNVAPETITVLPDGFDRELNSPFSSTHLLNSSEPVEQAAELLTCQFQVFADDPYMTQILGPNPSLQVLVTPPGGGAEAATDGITYLPETNEITFTNLPSDDPPSTSSLKRYNLDSGVITTVPLSSPIGSLEGNNNGLGPFRGQVLQATLPNLFDTDHPAGIAVIDPYQGNWTWLINNYFGLRFNGIDDLICLQDGTVIFSDSNYAEFVEMSKAPGQLPDRIYALPYGGLPRVLLDVADLVDRTVGSPNGVEVSPDESTLYLGVAPIQQSDAVSTSIANQIYAFDIVRPGPGEIYITNKRLFASDDVGYPDGFRVDSNGYLFTTAGDGIHVYSPGGKLVGKLIVPPNSNVLPEAISTVAFAGNKFVMSHNNDILYIQLNTQGVISTATF